MKTYDLTSRLKFVPLNDKEGDFGVFIVHTNNEINYTITVNNETELKAAIESFQDNPVGVDFA